MEEYGRYKHVYAIFISMLPVVGITYYINDVYMWGISKVFLFIGILGLLLLIHGCFCARKQPVICVCFAVLLCIGLIVVWYHREWFEKNPEDTMELLKAAAVLAICVGAYIISKIYVLRVALAMGLLLGAIITGSNEPQIAKLSAVAVFVYIILVFMETCLASSVKRRGKKKETVVTTLLPLYVASCLLLLIVPTSSECFQWRMAKALIYKMDQCITQVNDYIKGRKDPLYGEFSIGITGYSGSGEVGGSIFQSKKEAISLSSNTLKRRAMYLQGNRKDTFRNNRWEETIEEKVYPLSVKEDSMDSIELLYALYRYNGLGDSEKYIRRSSVHIAYNAVRTKAIFTMGKMSGISFNFNAKERNKSMIRNTLKTLSDRETEYDMEYYDMNLEDEAFNRFIQQEESYQYGDEDGDSGSEAVFASVLRRHSMLSYIAFPDQLEKALAKRKKYIYDHYTGIDESEKPQIEGLTRQVTSGKTDRFRQLQAIEQYLRTFTYTTSPKRVSNDKDVVLQFLFDSHEGYCTYFASAMALMGRSIGIPTRYVEGYLVDADKEGWMSHTVLEKDAHAWVEAYIDGVGWIPFEPTAGYGADLNAAFEPPKVELPQNMVRQTPYIVDTVDNVEVRQTRNYVKTGGIGVVIALFIMGGLLVVGLYIRIIRNKKRYLRLSIADQYRNEILRMRAQLHYLNYDREESETWMEFVKRISINEGDNLPLLEQAADTYSRFRYYKEIVTKKELNVIKEQNDKLKQLLKRRLSKRRFHMACLKLDLMLVKNTTVKMS